MGQKYYEIDACGNTAIKNLPADAMCITFKADEYPTISTTSETCIADPRYFVGGIVTSNDIVPSEPINIKLHFFDITDVRVYNDKVVKVFFADNTFEMAKVDESDTFDLETGIGICITKKALSVLCSPYCFIGNNGNSSEKSGTYYYNKLIRKALKVMNKRIAEEEKAEREKQAALERRKKKRAKKERRKSRRNRRGWLG